MTDPTDTRDAEDIVERLREIHRSKMLLPGSVRRALREAATEITRFRSLTTESEVARRFHATYERLAPSHGYETRAESAVPWEDVPENQRALMVATVREVMTQVRPEETYAETVRADLAAEAAARYREALENIQRDLGLEGFGVRFARLEDAVVHARRVATRALTEEERDDG